jgi:hypothetical protein
MGGLRGGDCCQNYWQPDPVERKFPDRWQLHVVEPRGKFAAVNIGL